MACSEPTEDSNYLEALYGASSGKSTPARSVPPSAQGSPVGDYLSTLSGATAYNHSQPGAKVDSFSMVGSSAESQSTEVDAKGRLKWWKVLALVVAAVAACGLGASLDSVTKSAPTRLLQTNAMKNSQSTHRSPIHVPFEPAPHDSPVAVSAAAWLAAQTVVEVAASVVSLGSCWANEAAGSIGGWTKKLAHGAWATVEATRRRRAEEAAAARRRAAEAAAALERSQLEAVAAAHARAHEEAASKAAAVAAAATAAENVRLAEDALAKASADRRRAEEVAYQREAKNAKRRAVAAKAAARAKTRLAQKEHVEPSSLETELGDCGGTSGSAAPVVASSTISTEATELVKEEDAVRDQDKPQAETAVKKIGTRKIHTEVSLGALQSPKEQPGGRSGFANAATGVGRAISRGAIGLVASAREAPKMAHHLVKQTKAEVICWLMLWDSPRCLFYS